MSDTVDTFLENYDEHLLAVDTAIQQLRAGIAEIEHKETEPGVRSSQITGYARAKQKIHRQISALEGEKTAAAQYKNKLSPVQKLVSDIDATIAAIEKTEGEVDKPSEVTQYAKQKAGMYEVKRKWTRWLKDADKEIDKLKNF